MAEPRIHGAPMPLVPESWEQAVRRVHAFLHRVRPDVDPRLNVEEAEALVNEYGGRMPPRPARRGSGRFL